MVVGGVRIRQHDGGCLAADEFRDGSRARAPDHEVRRGEQRGDLIAERREHHGDRRAVGGGERLHFGHAFAETGHAIKLYALGRELREFATRPVVEHGRALAPTED